VTNGFYFVQIRLPGVDANLFGPPNDTYRELLEYIPLVYQNEVRDVLENYICQIFRNDYDFLGPFVCEKNVKDFVTAYNLASGSIGLGFSLSLAFVVVCLSLYSLRRQVVQGGVHIGNLLIKYLCLCSFMISNQWLSCSRKIILQRSVFCQSSFSL